MTDETPTDQPTYGVWIPGQGWVRSGPQNKPFADQKIQVAQELARRLGKRAKVYYIDPALFDLEEALLKAEKERTFRRQVARWFRKDKDNAVSQ